MTDWMRRGEAALVRASEPAQSLHEVEAAGPERVPVRVSLDWVVLFQIAFCVLPAMVAVRWERPELGARWLFAAVFVCMAVDLFFRSPPADLALIIATLPALALMRDLFLYNSIIILLAIPIANLALRSRPDFRRMRRTGVLLLGFMGLFYWLASYVLTGDYFSNLRVFELVLGAGAIVMLAPRRPLLATALLGSMISLIAIGLAFLGFSERLSYATVGGVLLGNPISYGVPLALVLTLCVADGGRWLLLQRLPGTRLAISLLAGILLLLSTSRASWLAAALNLFLIALLNGRHRKFLIVAMATLVIGTTIVMRTSEHSSLQDAFNRTFSDKGSLLHRTSGRSDMWRLFPFVMARAPLWGFGPGSGKDIYARFSVLDPSIRFERGDQMAWHALYLQVGVETGVIGLLVMIALMTRLGMSAYQHWARTHEILPLLGFMGFGVVAGTVSGMDAFSGMFLGCALLAIHVGRRRRRRGRGRRAVHGVAPREPALASTP